VTLGEHYLEDALRQLAKLKQLADGAIAQVSDEDLLRAPHPDGNSIALQMKHVAGNMRSRWTDFLTSDGEKPDRRRDSEFELEDGDTAASLRARWEAGWALVLVTVGALGADDLLSEVTVRGEAHTVMQAIDRQISHYAYHVGQIVQSARAIAGASWKSLSIPRGQSSM
jgi:hypothetical protein